MAIYTTEGQSQQDALLNVADRVADGGKIGAQLRAFRVTRVVSAADVTSAVMHLIQLPTGARVVPDSLRIYADVPCTTAYNIAKIGDLADDDRYCATGINASAGGYFAATPAVTGPVNDYKVGDAATDTGWITATLGTVTTPTVGADVTFTGQYSIAN